MHKIWGSRTRTSVRGGFLHRTFEKSFVPSSKYKTKRDSVLPPSHSPSSDTYRRTNPQPWLEKSQSQSTIKLIRLFHPSPSLLSRVQTVLLDSMEPTSLPVDLRHRRADSISWVPPLPTAAHGPAPFAVQLGARNLFADCWQQVKPLIWYLPTCVAVTMLLPELWKRLPISQLQALN